MGNCCWRDSRYREDFPDLGDKTSCPFIVKAVDDIVAVKQAFVCWAVVSRRCVLVFGGPYKQTQEVV